MLLLNNSVLAMPKVKEADLDERYYVVETSSNGTSGSSGFLLSGYSRWALKQWAVIRHSPLPSRISQSIKHMKMIRIHPASAMIEIYGHVRKAPSPL